MKFIRVCWEGQPDKLRGREVELAGDCYVTIIGAKFKVQQPCLEYIGGELKRQIENNDLYFHNVV